jgi:hypothetical protein
MPARIVPRDQHCQFERLGEADPADLPGCGFGN